MAHCILQTLITPADKLLLSELKKLGGHSAISGRYDQFVQFVRGTSKAMDVEITKYEKPTGVDGEIERLQEFARLIESNSITEIKERLDEHRKSRKSGLFNQIENDIAGFFELRQTNTRSWVLRPKFRRLTRNQIKELLLNRVNSIKDGPFEMPENLFEVRTIRILINEQLIDVEEVSRKTWDYILFKSPYYKDEYYVNIAFEQSFVSWDKDFKLTETEAEIASHGNEEEITTMIHQKRNENRS